MCHDFYGSEQGRLRRATWIGLFDENWSGGRCGMRSDPGEAWPWDQCGGVTVDSGEFVAEDECGNSGTRGVDHLEQGHTC